MSRKMFSHLKAIAQNRKVCLTFYKSTPFFSSPAGEKMCPVIRIYRKEEPNFEFGKDYAEFFDGTDYRDARKIFAGPLKEYNHRKYEFVDTKVDFCRTYSYWVSLPRHGNPVGPVPVRVRDPEVWWPQEKIERYMDIITDNYRGYVQKKKFGRTIRGNDINGLIAGKAGKTVALIGTLHAGESGPELILPALEKILERAKKLLEETRIAVLPSVNIDEREILVHGCPWYRRCNANGVDINRNFDAEWEKVEYGYGLVSSDPDSSTYRGKFPESEPETRAVVNFINEVKPKVVFSFHGLASICGASFVFSKYAVGDAHFKRKAKMLAEAYTQGMYPDEKRGLKLYPEGSAGSLPTWLYLKRGIVGFDLEHDGSENAKPSLTDFTTLKLVREYQERHYNGIVQVMKKLAGERS